jgi:Rha family phage regulatory protein
MTQLQLINEHGKIYVDSRQVAEMIGKRHADLMRSIDGYIEILGQNAKLRSDNFFVKSSYQAGTGKTYPCYKLTRKGCDMVANKLTGAKGILFTAEYVTRFEEMEKQLQTQQLLPNFNDPVASARAWADAMEAKQKALLELKEAQPKIEFAEAIQASNESISVSTFAKILKQNGIDTGERRLYEYLRNHGYLCSSAKQHNLPRQLYMEKGYFEVDTKVFKTPWTTKYTHIPKITPKGQEYFLNHFLKTKCE